MNDTISIFKNATATVPTGEMPLDDFLAHVINGKWQDLIIPLRAEKDKDNRAAAKKNLPAVTISGKFGLRQNDGVIEHSSRIAMDIDDDALEGMDLNEVKERLSKDEHIYAVFTSCGGRGLCAIFTINPKKHTEAWEGLAEYLLTKYGLVVDQNAKGVSRLRFVSYDPAAIVPARKKVFTQYPKKDKTLKSVKEVVFVQNHFEQIIADIKSTGSDIAPTYGQWFRVGIALADKFGERGRDYFHIVSSNNGTYTDRQCNNQYNACLEAKGAGVTMGTFYHYCKQAGINIVDETISKISKRAYSHKIAGSSIEHSLTQFDGFDKELVLDIVTQIFDKNKNIVIGDSSEIEAIRIWLANNYNLWLNLVDNNIYNGKERVKNRDLDLIEGEVYEALDIPFQLITRVYQSVIPKKHPIKDFFAKYESRNPVGSIAKLAACIKSPTGEGTDYVERMVKKWLVGAVACIYGEEPHMMLVLCGEYVGSGKSYFFKNLLPLELKDYCVCKDFSLLSNPTDKKDIQIACTKSWLVFDDEMGNKSKRDHRLIKALLSFGYSDNRGPFLKVEEHLKRICFFGGTSNDLDVIQGSGKERRIVPIRVEEGGIDREAKDRIDPVDYIMEAYHLYNSGYDFRILGEEIDFLNEHTAEHKQITTEEEVVAQYYKKPEPGAGEYKTATQILDHLQPKTTTKLWLNKVIDGIRKLGILQERPYINGVQRRAYYVQSIQDLYTSNTKSSNGYIPVSKKDDADLPF